MARPKGQEKKGGRVKGTPNKATSDIRSKFQSIIEGNIDQVMQDMKELKPVERVKYTLEMAKFCLPTLKSIDYVGEIKVTERKKIEFVDKV
jgi:hypothetical protein